MIVDTIVRKKRKYVLQNKNNQDTLSKCVKCHRIHTLHMMIQVNNWANRYKCVKCFNLSKIVLKENI